MSDPLPPRHQPPADPAAQRSIRRRAIVIPLGRIIGWGLLAVIGLVAIRTVVDFRGECARWLVAAALEQHLDGELENAQETLEQAFQWQPDNVLLLQLRSDWHIEAHRYQEALDDAERIVKLAPRKPLGYLQRSLAYQHLGRHREAVDDWNTLAEMANEAGWVPLTTLDGGLGTPHVFNARGYARAVGNLELKEGLADAERAIEQLGPRASLLDTRGYLFYRLGKHALARKDLDAAVTRYERTFAYQQKQLDPAAQDENWDPDDNADEVDIRRLRRQLKDSAQVLAVLRYHRALVFDKLDLSDEADADRARVRELGFEPTPALF